MTEKLNEALKAQYQERALAELEAGATIEINTALEYISLTMSNNEEYFLENESYTVLMNDVPENLHPEDYILAVAQNW